MEHFSIQPTSSLRRTPPDARVNRDGSQASNLEETVYGRRKRSGTLKLPAGINRGAYTGSIFPNGEFTVGYVGFARIRVDEKRYERGIVGDVQGVSPSPDCVDVSECSISVPHSERTFSELALSVAQNHHKVVKPYGRNGITPFGKRMVRNGAERIQSVNTLARTGFFTLTLPEYPDVIRAGIARNWGYLTRTFFQELTREHKRHNRPFSYVAVTEIQTRRWLESGNPGWHIHYVCPIYRLSPKRGDYFITADWIRNTWQRLLQNVIDSIPLDGVEFRTPLPRIDTQRVHSSASAYLAKYMSKGSDLANDIAEQEGEDYIPRQWWSMSTNLRAWVKSNTHRLSEDAITAIFQTYKNPENTFILYANPIMIMHPCRGEIMVAISGRIDKEFLSSVTQI